MWADPREWLRPAEVGVCRPLPLRPCLDDGSWRFPVRGSRCGGLFLRQHTWRQAGGGPPSPDPDRPLWILPPGCCSCPEQVTHLVLAATSGGLPMAGHAAKDWRPAFRVAHPLVPEWFASTSEDLGARLPSLRMPSLLLWGDADPISPVGVGQRLASLLPESRLIVLSGGSHDVAMEKAEQVAPLIDHHLTPPP